MSVEFSHAPTGNDPTFYPIQPTQDMLRGVADKRACLFKHNSPQLCKNPLFIPRIQRLNDGTVFGTRSPIRCNSWTCEPCREVRLKYLYAMLCKHCPVDKFHFLTLTLRGNRKSTRENWTRLLKCWDIFLKRLRRKRQGLKFFRCVELTKKGMPHIHAVINYRMSNHRTHDIWHDITGDSFKARFELIRSSVAGYLIKYIDKGVNSIERIRKHTGKKTRIFTTSQGLFYIRPKKKVYQLIDFASCEYEAVNILQSEYDRSPPTWHMEDFPQLTFKGGKLLTFKYKLRSFYNDHTPKFDPAFRVIPPKRTRHVQYRLDLYHYH